MKRLLSVCLSLCIMVSVFVSFDITASAKTNLKKTTVSVSNISNGINVSWKKVSGAKSYKVYRKASGAKKYSVVKKTNNKTVKYLDKKVSAGKTYSYQVVAVKGKETSKSKTKSITRLLAPKNVNAKAYTSKNMDSYDYDESEDYDEYWIIGVKVTWTRSKGANKYDIYRQEGKGKYRHIATTKNSSSYIDVEFFDKKVNTYRYKVVARKDKYVSDGSKAKKIVYVPPADNRVERLAEGIRLEWSSVKGCDGYKLYRSQNGKANTYSLIGKFASNKKSYFDKTVSINKTYYYKIITYKGSAKSVDIALKIKYKPEKIVNVKVGETNSSIKNEIEKELKEETGITFEQAKEMIKYVPLNKNIATISDDFIVTGLSKGSTKVKQKYIVSGQVEESGFILINVN